MKKKRLTMLLFLLCFGSVHHAFAQADEIASLVVNLAKLLQIEESLTSMEKGYRTIKGGYTTIKGISEGNFKLHQVFLDGLLQVSPAVRKYYKIPEIIQLQTSLVRNYKDAYRQFSARGNFTPEQLSYIAGVYKGLASHSLSDLDDLLNVMTAGKLRMTDDERLSTIDRIHGEMEAKHRFLQNFNKDTGLISLQREKQKFEQQTVEGLYGKADKH